MAKRRPTFSPIAGHGRERSAATLACFTASDYETTLETFDAKSRHGTSVHWKKFSRRRTQKNADKNPINIGDYVNRRIICASSPFKKMCQSHLL